MTPRELDAAVLVALTEPPQAGAERLRFLARVDALDLSRANVRRYREVLHLRQEALRWARTLDLAAAREPHA